ncbi:HopJ type III effector protein [Shewanella gaetbuli]|uniref:HopJ type III effector protein n=1 Tax=Shewanella gaetbuli TaxID=220752 RepID=A0A9X1ZSF4_9GAMM|nr:HopJ type III effector protein [Shewanella gaetbuli]MCL1141351.1 HopJ type III effector protein [Shewanella gaetbuli]
MSLSLNEFIQSLDNGSVEQFDTSLAVFDAYYDYVPSTFTNGEVVNQAGENGGSCKVFSFAKIHNLSEQATLNLFGQHYRDVVANPRGSDHQNIRQFMQHGWQGIKFDTIALTAKA